MEGQGVVSNTLLRSGNATYLMFSFPELVVAIMGALIWVGGYTGYRAAELLRFWAYLEDEDSPGGPA